MRLVKVRIRAGDVAKGEDQMVYPDRYNAAEVDRYGMYASQLNPATVSLSGDIGRGGSEEFCIIALPDALAEEYADDPEIMIVDSTEADTLMEQWRVNNGAPEESTTSSSRLEAIRAKMDAGVELSQEDTDALDINKPTPGVGKTRQPIAEKMQLLGQTINEDMESISIDKKKITPER